MYTVYPRVVKWNSLRYDREFNLALTIKLLREEHLEWLQAKTPVDKLDGLCDVIYVALGAIWKAGIQEGDLMEAEMQAAHVVQNQIDCNELWPAYYIGTYLDVLEHHMDYPLANSLQLIISSALTEMAGMHLTHDECIRALHIVCDSNDTKTIYKLKSGDKGGSKGEYFIPPEPHLAKLLEKAHARLN